MKNKNNTKEKEIKGMTRILLVLTLSLLLISLAAAQFPQPPTVPAGPMSLPEPILPKSLIQNQPSYFYQYYQEDPAMQYGFEPEMCDKDGMDFIVQIMPDACTPAPVRSDLLEEQNVPVFCRLTGIKINPLIQVPYIKRIEAMTELRSPEIFSVTYHPPKSALSFMSYQPPQNKDQLEGVPTMSNLGYLVIFLKRQPQESKMPDQVTLEESLRLTYSVARTFGISQNSFVLSEITHEEWQDQYKKYSFWNGKGYLKLEEIQNNKATISVYKNTQQKIGSETLAAGEKSDEIKLPGYYCGAGVKLQVDEITTPKVRARMLVNGEEVLLGKGEDILDTECQIKDVYSTTGAFTGIVEIRCRNNRYTLELKNLKAFFSIQGQPPEDLVEKSIGDDLGSGEKHVYIGYIGKEKVVGGVKSFIMVFNKDNEKEIKPKDKNQITNVINDIIKDKREIGEGIPQTIDNEINNILERARIGGIKTQRINYGESINEFTLKKTTGLIEATYSKEIEDAFEEAIEEYKHVADVYSLVPNPEGTIYGIKALDAAAKLAEKFIKKETQAKLLTEMIDKFTGVESDVSGDIDKAKKDLANLLSSDPSKSSTIISTDQGNYRITLLSIDRPNLASQSILIDVDGEERVYTLHQEIEDGWRIEEVQEKQITLKCIIPNCGTETDKIFYGKTYNLGINRDFDTKDSTFTLEQINLIKEVKVTILPFEAERTTTTNFTIQIGIEKRAIKLNPEKTNERIQKLDSLISKVEGFRDGLGKVVSMWKKACLVGGTALWAKNFIQGLGGESLARKEAMDYWGEWCSDKSNWEPGTQTISGCYKENKDKINSDVDKTKTAIQTTNQFIKEVKSKDGVMKKSGFLGLGSSIDEEKFMEEADKLLKSGEYNNIENFDVDQINLQTLKKSGRIATEDVKETIFNLNMQKSCNNKELTDFICKKIEEKNNDLFKDYTNSIEKWTNREAQITNQNLDENLKKLLLDSSSLTSFGKIQIIDRPIEEVNVHGTKEWVAVGYTGKGGQTLLIVEETGTSGMFKITKKAYYLSSDGTIGEVIDWPEDKLPEELEGITLHRVDPKRCDGNVIAEEYKEIKFWESGPYKGMVALMPINTNEGFYVGTKGYTGFEGALVAYQDISGNIKTYTIGNVGPDHKIDFDFTTGQAKSGSDDCSSTVSLLQGTDVHVTGIIDSRARNLDQKAKSCIQEAIKSYNRGDRIIKTGKCGNFKLGKPPTVRPTAQCEDFMSPQDCWIMYNLCDPVMCPASRCDLGGNYPVDNVFSTGIVGSLMLCWPNFENGKGVIVPICLTGVHRGLDDLAVTLKLARDCLEENMNTGKMTGICDQILSIYLCDFLWQNLDPLIKVGIPSLTQSLTNRGGGEYALFSESWKNSIDSIDYFTQYYGMNTFKAFKERSTKQVGTEVCKRFISVAYPTQAKFWEEISKPESPTTFFATLQELEGVAGTQSHYKIYYQIYAGQDQGVAYRIYLKSPPSPGYYIIPDRYYVPNGYGYLAAGEYTGESPDFIAPTGYKEICVDINGQDHCGFGQVTTNFAIDELQNLYLKEQLEKQVTKTKDCISGAPTFIPAPTLNLQSAIKTTIEPAIYKRGIIRICSSGDPGAGVDEDRYSLVGYCDNKQVGCWLDMHSVNDSISDLGIRADIVQQAETKEINQFVDKYGLDKPADSKSLLTNAEKLITEEGGIKKIIEFLEEQVKQEVEKDDKVDSMTKESIERIEKEINSLIITFEEISSQCIYDSEKARADYNIALLYEYIARIAAAEEITRTDKEIQDAAKTPLEGKEDTGITEEFLPFEVWPVSGHHIMFPGRFNFKIANAEYKDCLKENDKYIEIYTKEDDVVKAVAEGTVISGKESNGDYIIIEHSPNLYTFYGNLDPRLIRVSKGDTIEEAGEEIGVVKNVRSDGRIEPGEQNVNNVLDFIQKPFLKAISNAVTRKKFGKLYFKVFTSQDFSKEKSKDPLCFFSQNILEQISKDNSMCYLTFPEAKEYYDSEKCQEQREEKYEISSGPFNQWPLDINKYNVLGSRGCYGYRSLSWVVGKDYTDGIDIRAPGGTAVYAVASGEVFYVSENCGRCSMDPGETCRTGDNCNCNGGYGNSVIIKHEDNLFTAYNHLKTTNVKKGDKIITSQKLGTVGSTGCSSDDHLDLKIYTSAQDLYLYSGEKGKHPLCFFSSEIRTKIDYKTSGALTDSKSYIENKDLFGTEDGGCNPSAEYCSKFVSFGQEPTQEQLECGKYNKDNCEDHLGCWWDQGWWFTGGCRECPETCEGKSISWGVDLKFDNPNLCEETAKRQCGLDCEWKYETIAGRGSEIKGCVDASPEKKLENMMDDLSEFYSQEIYKINIEEVSSEELESYLAIFREAKSKIETIKSFVIQNNLKIPTEVSPIEGYVDRMIDEINKILFGGNVIIASQNNEGIFTTDNKIISYWERKAYNIKFPKICAFLKQNNEYYNNKLAGEVTINNQEIDSLGNNVQIRWYKIKALRDHQEGGFSGPFPTIKDSLLGQSDENYYHYQNIGVGSANAQSFWSQGKDTIQYSSLLEIPDTEDKWCIDLGDDFGTYRFRVEITIDRAETFYSLGRPASAPEVTTMEGYNDIYSDVKELIIEPAAYDFNNGGIKTDVHRISVRSNYKADHGNYVSRYGTTDNEMLFMEYIEAHKGIVWLWGAKEWQQEEFIGMDCADIVVDSINKMIDDKIISADKLSYGTTANWLANNKKINDEIYYFDYIKKEFYELSNPENNIEIPITSTPQAVHVGDLFLLTKGSPAPSNDYPCYHTLIFYEDGGIPGILDKDDVFVYIGHAGLTNIPYFAFLKPLTTQEGIYFIRARLDELN